MGLASALICARTVTLGIALSAAAACSKPQARPLAESNLGAVPAYTAIANAKAEVVADHDDPEAGMILWNDSDIRPLGRGWCVVLHGVGHPDGKLIHISVYVEQDGRAWRSDAVGRKKYTGGADGLYTAPIVANKCRLPSSAAK